MLLFQGTKPIKSNGYSEIIGAKSHSIMIYHNGDFNASNLHI